MNVFRLLFLITCLASSLLWAIVSVTPATYEQSVRDNLAQQLEAESRAVLLAETVAGQERALLAAQVAMNPGLVDALRPAQPTMGADGTPVLPVRPAPQAAFGAATGATAGSSDVIALFDADGALLAPTGPGGVVSPAELGEEAGLAEALRSRTASTQYLSVAGQLYATSIQPVISGDGALLGAVLVADVYDTATAVARRGASRAQVAFFVNRDVVGISETDSARAGLTTSLARRLTALDLGTANGLRRVEFDEYTPDASSGALPTMLVASAPVSLSDASVEIGAIVTVDALRPPPTLLAILIEAQAFAESTLVLWVYLAIGFGLFVVGLFIHDFAVDRSVGQLANRIVEAVTNNDPPPVLVGNLPAMLRPIGRAFNAFLDAYRAQLSAARRAREEAELARDAAEHAKEEAVTSHNEAMSARVNVESRVREAEARVRAETSQIGGQPLPSAAMAERQVRPAPVAPPIDDFSEPGGIDISNDRLVELSGSQVVVSEPEEPAESLDDLAEAMEFEANENEKNAIDPEAAAEMEEIVAQFSFDGPSIRTEARAAAAAEPATIPPKSILPTPDAGSYDPAAQTAPPSENPRAVRRSTQLLAAVGGIGSPPPATEPIIARLAPPTPPQPPPLKTGRHTAVSGSLRSVTSDAVAVSDTLGVEPRAVLATETSAAPISAVADAPASPAVQMATPAAPAVAAPVVAAVPAPPAVAATHAAAPETAPAKLRRPSADFEVVKTSDAPPKTEAPPGAAPPAAAPPATPAPPASAAQATHAEDPTNRRGVSGRFAGVFEEPKLDEMLDALDSIQDQSLAGTVPRASREDMARKAAEAQARKLAEANRPAADAMLAAAEERLKRLRSPTGTVQAIHSQLPGVTAAAPVVPAEPIPGDTPEARTLYSEFIETRRQCNEPDDLPYDRFVRRLEKNRTALKTQLGCADVKFRVDVEAGKATLKATPIR
jgi:hypothetical protein